MVIGALNCLVQSFKIFEFGVVGVFLQEALAADNLFHHLTYEGAVDLEKVDDPVERAGLEAQVHPIENPLFSFSPYLCSAFHDHLGYWVALWPLGAPSTMSAVSLEMHLIRSNVR
jgi:hypothetical protein